MLRMLVVVRACVRVCVTGMCGESRRVWWVDRFGGQVCLVGRCVYMGQLCVWRQVCIGQESCIGAGVWVG